MCTQYLHCIHLPTPSFITYPLPQVPLHPSLFCPPVLQFCRKKKIKKKPWCFCREFPCVVSIYVCITTSTRSYPLVLTSPLSMVVTRS
jgi:hypothetical protein